MKSRPSILYLYWALPVLFLVWELSLAEMPYVRSYLPQNIRESITSPPHSMAQALAYKLLPLAYVFSTMWKYTYITICFMVRKNLKMVLIFTSVITLAILSIDVILYLPHLINLDENHAPYNVRIFHFMIGAISKIPFYLCVYYLIKRMVQGTARGETGYISYN